MWMNVRHGFFILIGIVALFSTWPYAFDWMRNGGNILNFPTFFLDAIKKGETAAFLSIDMLIAWMVYLVWVVGDAKKIGLGIKWGWFFFFLSYVQVSMAFPFYLVVRERFLDKQKRLS